MLRSIGKQFVESVQSAPRKSEKCLLVYIYGMIQGRLNQWSHWARAQDPRIFFLFEGPPTGCGEISF